MMGFVSEWKRLRQEIRLAPDRAKELDEEISEALYRYRIHLTRLTIKPHKLDRQLWDTYDSILGDIRRVRPKSRERLLQPTANLESLHQEWLAIFQRQNEFLNLIDETIERSEFYNKMERAKDDHGREREQHEKLQLQLSGARRSLIQALHYALLREKSGEGIASGSIILDLGLSIDAWEEGISNILNLQSKDNVPLEDEIGALEHLRQRIIEAPHWAEEVKDLEEKFDVLLSLEDQLRNLSGSGNLSDIEVNEFVELLRVDAKHYWAEANWEALDEIISRVNSYIQRELGPLQSQLYVLRKRKGHTPFANGSREAKHTVHDHDLGAGTADEMEEPVRESPDRSDGLYDGSLKKAIAENQLGSATKKVYVDPDADESVQSVFGGRKRDHGPNGKT